MLKRAYHHRKLGVLSVLCGSCICAAACSATDIRTWAFEATVIDIDDPDQLFGGVRKGDPVNGTFSYDLDTMAEPWGDQQADYEPPGTFQGVRVAIENPRTGDELRYESPEPYVLITVYGGSSWFDGVSSALFFSWEAEPPRPDLWGLLSLYFAGPDVLTDYALPTQLNLDDWQKALVSFGAGDDPFAATAQIHTLTPVMPGDYNLNGTVDADDYTLWRSTYGPTSSSEADWNRDGVVDAADYITWRNNAGSMFEPQPAKNVPEPATATLLVSLATAIAASGLFRRRA